MRSVAKGFLKPALVTPGGHRRFRLQEVEALAASLDIDPLHTCLITTGEAARLLGISQPTLNRAVRSGRLRPALVTPGGHRRFDGTQLSASLSFDARDSEGFR